MTDHKFTPWLSDDQVFRLNEKHGWFQYGDAGGHVSRAFVQDAIDMHERIRDAAQDLLAALEAAVECGLIPISSVKDGGANKYSRQVEVADQIRAAIAKALGHD